MSVTIGFSNVLAGLRPSAADKSLRRALCVWLLEHDDQSKLPIFKVKVATLVFFSFRIRLSPSLIIAQNFAPLPIFDPFNLLAWILAPPLAKQNRLQNQNRQSVKTIHDFRNLGMIRGQNDLYAVGIFLEVPLYCSNKIITQTTGRVLASGKYGAVYEVSCMAFLHIN